MLFGGYHVYKEVWDAAIDETELPCKKELHNPHDPSAVAIVKPAADPSGHGRIIVGHVPRVISTLCSIFIRRGGSLVCVVTGTRQYSADLPQGGLEIPCRYIFRSGDADCQKARKLVEELLSIKVKILEHAEDRIETGDKTEDKDAVDKSEDKAVDKTEDVQRPKVALPVGTSTDIQAANRSVDVLNIADDGDAEPPPKKRKLNEVDIEQVIMGEELSDLHINLAQQLLSSQFPEMGGLRSTLLQQKEIRALEKKNRILQIIHSCSRHHWLLATNIGNRGNEILVYDSIFKNLDKETKKLISDHFPSVPVSKIRVVKSQKQQGIKDCGLFAIGYATALAHGQNMAKLRFRQESMRSHFINCVQQNKFTPFPQLQ